MVKAVAVLFDMDGVLIDSNAVIERAWREAAGLYGKTISDDEMAKHIHGQPGPHTIKALFGDLPLADRQRVQQYIIDAENTADYDPIPGVGKLISALHAAGVPVGIVTSGWRQKIDRVTAMLQVAHCISVIVERDDVARGKPHPDPYLLAARRLAVPAEQTVVFEDSPSGISAAVSAGACCIGIGGKALTEFGTTIAIADFTGVAVAARGEDEVVMSFGAEYALSIATSRP
ncbi:MULTISPECIES: HAD family hydrolase [Enterobacteriaceae]|uniref:HAD family hydrolase n=1 Tax=Enterobacteriaceae TaxID=543 RepID=UPI0015DC042D|nr:MULTISPECIES: HAD family phosphatase [unclassified Klebsiella]HAT3955200.1 HAD family phosphatase [Kluyvera ascorbata]BBR57411.1 hydrolase [Klebsiella sp. WP4-W18-ESBL-05]BBS90148.1 hydrolase [Klebsiella sp. WP7-S18-CRE-02]BBS95170.1 hydrolase [Klebsiella sp. WP7-S18-CRE-03]BBT00202.1 hydrolase [Klebsiella sp. WP7-S18-ESBL-04]